MREVREAEAAARMFGISLQTYDVTRLSELESAFVQIEQDRPQALLTFSDHRTIAYRNMIADFAAAHRLATIGCGASAPARSRPGQPRRQRRRA
jgi:hypothetical protein